MNKQTDEGFIDNKNTHSFNDNIVTDNKNVKKNKIAATSDADEYFFIKSRRRKGSKGYHNVKSEMNSDDDQPLVYSYSSGRRSKSKRRHHHHRRRKMKTWKKVLITIASVILALVIICTTTVLLLINRGSQELFNEDITVTAPKGVDVQDGGKCVVYNGDTYMYNDKVTSILCMGVDKRDINQYLDVKGEGGQADVLILISIDTETGKITMVNISRDAMTDVAIYTAAGSFLKTVNQQICLSYAYGDGKELSCENTVSSVKKLFYNIPVNTYFALDLDGISAINDSVGGVDVVSPETISKFTEGQSYHLMGDDAEAFVRTRNTNILDSNNYRMKRQKQYINSFMNKIIEQTKNDFSTPIKLYNDSAPYSCTNLNPSRVTYLAQSALKTGSNGIETVNVPGQVKDGGKYAEFHVDEKEFYEMFLKIYYKKL